MSATTKNSFPAIKLRGSSVVEVFKSELKQYIVEIIGALDACVKGRLTAHTLLRDAYFVCAKAIEKSKHKDSVDASCLFLEILQECFPDMSDDEKNLAPILVSTFGESYAISKKKWWERVLNVLYALVSALL